VNMGIGMTFEMNYSRIFLRKLLSKSPSREQ
jgi:hypothetical protein